MIMPVARNMSRNRIVLIAVSFAAILLLISLTSITVPVDKWTVPSTLSFPKSSYKSSGRDIRDDLARAEKLWEQSVKDRAEIKRAVGTSYRFPDDLWNPHVLWDFVRPTFYCPWDIERVGKLGDGGKWMCGMSRYEAVSPGPSSEVNTADPLIMYSFGVNTDSSFEAAFLERTNVEIWGYDFSVKGWASEMKPVYDGSRAHFAPYMLSAKTTADAKPPKYSIQDLMQRNGHDFIDILKIDIEGAEYEVLGSFLDALGTNGTIPIGQMLIELHLFNKGDPKPPCPQSLDEFMTWWERLEAGGLRPTYNEHNWIGDVAIGGHPRFIEYTMINVKHKKNKLL